MNVIALMLVKNEACYIRSVIRSVSEFVDEFLFIDNGSDDGTVEIAEQEGIVPIIEYDLHKTHEYIQPYVNSDVWVFGVDGDEIYYREGLKRLRKDMQGGKYDGAFQVQGWYLHVTKFLPGDRAEGYLGPPSHTPTKLYNMKNIVEWPPDGWRIVFMTGTRKTVGEKMRAQVDTWEESPLKCLHTRFLERSPLDGADLGVRLSPQNTFGLGSREDRGGRDDVNFRLKYRKGGIKEVNIWPIDGKGR